MILPHGLLARFSRDTRGAVAIIFSISLMVVIASMAVSIDHGTWISKKADLAGAADAGSLAGARELANAFLERDDANATDRTTQVATRYALENGGKQNTPQIQVVTIRPMSVTVH